MSLLRLITARQQASVDPAQAFITAAGITDSTQQAAITQLVSDLKSYNLWDKMKAVYPFVGGTATTHKYNLKDPRDLDAAFRLNFQGGWTHSSTGALPDGFSGYAITYVNPSVSLQSSSAHLSVYTRTNATSGMDLGVFTASGSVGTHMGISFSNQGFRCRLNSSTPSTGYTPPNTLGLFTVSRTDSTNIIGYNRGSSVFTTNSPVVSNLNLNIVLGAINNNGNIQDFSIRNFAFTSIGDGLSGTDVSNLYTAVQAFQTTLGRQV